MRRQQFSERRGHHQNKGRSRTEKKKIANNPSILPLAPRPSQPPMPAWVVFSLWVQVN